MQEPALVWVQVQAARLVAAEAVPNRQDGHTNRVEIETLPPSYRNDRPGHRSNLSPFFFPGVVEEFKPWEASPE
jgi:hypothetical protein